MSVDDEPLARDKLRILLQDQSDSRSVGECAIAMEATGAGRRLRPDVRVRDIQMPR
ncbi:two-component system response regulator YehT, partial [Erwinia amylovora]|nr:two-component system response regulator YehT [Erwinia amylovora]